MTKTKRCSSSHKIRVGRASTCFKHFNRCVFLLQLWVKIVDGDIQDSTRSDLYEYIVDFLTFCSDQDLVWKYSEWVLQKNEEVCDQCTFPITR